MKKTTCVLLILISVFFITTPVYAKQPANSDLPKYENVDNATVNLYIRSDGYASVELFCSGSSDVTRIVATTYFQRKIGLIWVRADIGTANNELVYTVYSRCLSCVQHTNLPKSGKYRVRTTYTVYGNEIAEYSASDTYSY